MRAHMLLTVTISGTVYRIADDDIDVDHARKGTSYAYVAGLSAVTVTSALDFLAATASYVSVPVECIFPVGVAQLAARGMHLARSDVELALIEEGADFADRQILASGQASDPTYGAASEPVAFSIERVARASSVMVPGADEVVDGTTHPDSITTLWPEDLGQSYPLVFGLPEAVSVSGGSAATVEGSQGVWSSINAVASTPPAELVIAGHAVDMTYVYLVTDDHYARQFPVFHRLDGRGQTIAFIPAFADYPTNADVGPRTSGGQTWHGLLYSASGATEFEASTEPLAVWVWWYDPLGGTGGLSPYAPDVITYMLTRAGLPVPSFGGASDLSGYRFDCCVDAPVKPEDWLQANIYPLLPISMVDGPDGFEAVVWRFGATVADVSAQIDVDSDGGIARAGVMTTDSGDVANWFVLRYQYSVRLGRYTGSLTRGDEANPDAYCLASQATFGVIEKVIETGVVYDRPTGEAILAWMARAYAFPRRRVSYMLPSTYALTRGQIVTLTDSELALVAVICLVSEVQVDGTEMMGVEFLLIADPLRDAVEV